MTVRNTSAKIGVSPPGNTASTKYVPAFNSVVKGVVPLGRMMLSGSGSTSFVLGSSRTSATRAPLGVVAIRTGRKPARRLFREFSEAIVELATAIAATTSRADAAIAGRRQIQRQHFSGMPTRRARIGRPPAKRRKSSAIALAVAYRFAGVFSIAFKQIVSRSRGIDWHSERGRAGSHARI